jgi:hypothetical protein
MIRPGNQWLIEKQLLAFCSAHLMALPVLVGICSVPVKPGCCNEAFVCVHDLYMAPIYMRVKIGRRLEPDRGYAVNRIGSAAEQDARGVRVFVSAEGLALIALEPLRKEHHGATRST